jgi:hypothetical protein
MVGVHLVEQFRRRRIEPAHRWPQPGILAVVMDMEEIHHHLQMLGHR